MKQLLAREYTKQELIGIVMILIGIGLLIDLFVQRNIFINLLLGALALYLGFRWRKKSKNFLSMVLIIIGAIMLIFAILSSAVFFILLIGALFYFGYQWFHRFSKPNTITVQTRSADIDPYEGIAYVEPFFKSNFFGVQADTEEIHLLEDINIQYGFGDVHLDLSNTMIPEGETVIIVRGGIGNVQIFIPYDIELSLHTSSLFGKTDLLGRQEFGINKTVKFQMNGYYDSKRKIKIITSLLVGDIEVRNI